MQCLLDLWRVGLLPLRNTDVLLPEGSMSSISGELKPGDIEPLSRFPFLPRKMERLLVERSMKLWPVILRRSCEDRRLSCSAMLGGLMDTKDDVVEVAVLLRDRKLKTELLLPEALPSRRSGEGGPA
jgi:hypothetical protein